MARSAVSSSGVRPAGREYQTELVIVHTAMMAITIQATKGRS
jgi:hypothetical protein